MLNKSISLNENRVKDANEALEDSMDTREMVKFNLSRCSDKEDLAELEMDLEELNTTSLNGKVRSRHVTLRHLMSHSWCGHYTLYPLEGGSLTGEKPARTPESRMAAHSFQCNEVLP